MTNRKYPDKTFTMLEFISDHNEKEISHQQFTDYLKCSTTTLIDIKKFLIEEKLILVYKTFETRNSYKYEITDKGRIVLGFLLMINMFNRGVKNENSIL